MATQRARGAASGIAVTSKSLMNVVLETTKEGEEDVFRLRMNASTMARSKMMEASAILFKGRMLQIQAMARAGKAMAGGMMTAGQMMSAQPSSTRAGTNIRDTGGYPDFDTSYAGSQGDPWSGGLSFGQAQQQADNPTW